MRIVHKEKINMLQKVRKQAQEQLVMRNRPALKSKETRLDDYLLNMAHFNPNFWL